MIVVVMGVCGSGKTSVGRLLAERLDWVFIEGDDLHPEANRRKMAAGTPLTDEDRRPWLDRIVGEMRRADRERRSVVVACSALRRIYRDRLRGGGADVRFLHLTGAPALLRARMERRDGHFMPAGLLDSQLATLEPAGPAEHLHGLDVAQDVETLVQTALGLLGSHRFASHRRTARSRPVVAEPTNSWQVRFDTGIAHGTRLSDVLRPKRLIPPGEEISMNQDRRTQAEQLVAALEPSLPPIAVAFSDAVPDGVPEFDGSAPAGCLFWQEAAKRTFATSAGHHALCSIGIHTMNLTDAPASQPEELQSALQAMMGLDYVREEEVAAIPVVQREVKHAIYGPLADFPTAPDVVLLFADGRQGLVLSEAIARVDGSVPPAMGRPACAALPQAFNHGVAAMSLGCCGARAYLDAMSDDTAMWVLPGGRLDEYCEHITTFANANRVLAMFHERRRADVEAGMRPTVQESLQRLA